MNINISSATAITTAGVAVLVAIITLRNWITNRARLKHELFDRRYAIYEKIAGFISQVLLTGTVEGGGEEKFLRETKKAYFAFGCDKQIKKLVSDIYRKAVELHALQSENKLTGDALKNNLEQQMKIKNWFSETLDSLETIFKKYFRLKH